MNLLTVLYVSTGVSFTTDKNHIDERPILSTVHYLVEGGTND